MDGASADQGSALQASVTTSVRLRETARLGANRHTTTRESVQNTPGGSERVVEHRDVMT
jgi:hypothetical protein